MLPGDWRRAPVRVGLRFPLQRQNGSERSSEDFLDVRIETLNPIHVARIRNVGPYTEVGSCFEWIFRGAAGIGTPPSSANACM